jgi:hypothetical protein
MCVSTLSDDRLLSGSKRLATSYSRSRTLDGGFSNGLIFVGVGVIPRSLLAFPESLPGHAETPVVVEDSGYNGSL